MQAIGAKLVETLTSRKFWAAVASSAPFVLEEPRSWVAFALVWMTYAGLIGIGEAAHKFGLPPPSQEQAALRKVLEQGIAALNRQAEPVEAPSDAALPGAGQR